MEQGSLFHSSETSEEHGGKCPCKVSKGAGDPGHGNTKHPPPGSGTAATGHRSSTGSNVLDVGDLVRPDAGDFEDWGTTDGIECRKGALARLQHEGETLVWGWCRLDGEGVAFDMRGSPWPRARRGPEPPGWGTTVEVPHFERRCSGRDVPARHDDESRRGGAEANPSTATRCGPAGSVADRQPHNWFRSACKASVNAANRVDRWPTGVWLHPPEAPQDGRDGLVVEEEDLGPVARRGVVHRLACLFGAGLAPDSKCVLLAVEQSRTHHGPRLVKPGLGKGYVCDRPLEAAPSCWRRRR